MFKDERTNERPVKRVSIESKLEHVAPKGREDLPPTSAPKVGLLQSLRDAEPGTRLMWEGQKAPGWARELAHKAGLELVEEGSGD